jgi:hypothetical protein
MSDAPAQCGGSGGSIGPRDTQSQLRALSVRGTGGELVLTLEPNYELAMPRAYCIKKDFQKVRLSHLPGTSTESFGNTDSHSVVVPSGASPIGQGDPAYWRQFNTMHKSGGQTSFKKALLGTNPTSSVSRFDAKAAWNFDFSSLPRPPFR